MKTQITLFALIATAIAKPTQSINTRSNLAKRAYGGPPSTGEVCPQAQSLYHQTTSGKYYQVACSVDTAGDTSMAVYPGVKNVLECAQKCDTWNSIAATNPKCFSATFYLVAPNGHDNCILRPGASGWYAFAPASGAETAVLV